MEENLKKVSVIIPVYNVEPYLHHCLTSITQQTYSNLEIICVYTRSKDKSLNILEEEMKNDSRIQLIKHDKGGLGGARNCGLKKATGEFILFVDSDDWIAKDMVEKLHTTLYENNSDIAESGYYSVTTEGEETKSSCSGNITIVNSIGALEGMYDWKFFVPMVWNKLYKSSIMKSITFPENIPHEDEFTTYKAYLEADRIAYIDLPLYFYNNDREARLSTAQYNVKELVACDAFRERMHVVWERNYKELEQKANDNYAWVLFHNISQCYKHRIHGRRVRQIVKNAIDDFQRIQLENRPLSTFYYERFELLNKWSLKKAALSWQIGN